MKCLLVSFFNSGNLGDCLIGEGLYKQVSPYFETEKYSYSGSYNIITDINNIKLTSLPDNQNLKGKTYDKLKQMKLTLPILLYKKLTKKRYNLAPLQKKLDNVDVLVIGGGNMIFDKDKYSNSALKFDEFVSLAKDKNKIVFAMSIGIGPFQTKRQEENAILALSKCDFITFRDQKSYDIYAKSTNKLDNVFLSIDPVFSLPLALKEDLKVNGVIGINIFNSKLIDVSNGSYNKLIKSYVNLINLLIQKLKVRVIIFSTDIKDYSAVDQVLQHFKNNNNVEKRDVNGLNNLLDIYQNIDVLIASRMHSMIIAYTQKVPLIGLSWQPKVDAFFDIIDSQDVIKYTKLEENLESILTLTKFKMENKKKEKEIINEKLNEIKLKRKIDEKILLSIVN